MMAQRVNLDAMIRREDFAREFNEESKPPIVRELDISKLLPDAPIRRQLRKPEFQRETNHWTPEQVVRLIKSFIDGDVIPSIILWRSTNFIFVIDGAHRLSALCAWISDDYGDRVISSSFYDGVLSREQRRIADRTRKLVEKEIGNFKSLEGLVGNPSMGLASKRAGSMFSQPIYLQEVIGTPKVAEDSFFAINSQGTPLDDTEKLLIKARNKPIGIGSRAIVRGGTGHPYWSAFSQKNQQEVVELSGELHRIVFEPEVKQPSIKTLDLPLGGSASPVDALAVLVDFLAVVNGTAPDKIADLLNEPNDDTGERTIVALRSGLKIAKRITGNSAESLGLHPAVYFTNERGRHSRFLFLGMVMLLTEKLRYNDGGWFRRFTMGRRHVEAFLIKNKSLIGIILQNLAKSQRTPKMRDLFDFLVVQAGAQKEATPESVIGHLGLSGRTYDVSATSHDTAFSEETKYQIFYREQIKLAQICPICHGLLDVSKSVSYDHVTRVADGGLGTAENGQMVHPYCNTAMKN